jgi:hypothetical protein
MIGLRLSRVFGIALPTSQWQHVFIGMFLSRFTGEHFPSRSRAMNAFNGLFFYSVVMALLVFAIAIPFFLQDYTSLPLTVSILTGLMWLPLSWIIQHWVGIFHAVARMVLVTLAWYIAPNPRFVVVPAIIIVIYVVTIAILETRRQRQFAAAI